MNSLLKVVGVDALVRLYRNIYFNGPGVVRLSGLGLLVLIGVIHLFALPEHYRAAPYLGVTFGALVGGTLISVLGILQGRRRGWTLGAALCGVAFMAYLISRVFGLPGFGEAIGAWSALGTVSLGTELLFVGLYVSIITGMNIAAPDQREWYE